MKLPYIYHKQIRYLLNRTQLVKNIKIYNKYEFICRFFNNCDHRRFVVWLNLLYLIFIRLQPDNGVIQEVKNIRITNMRIYRNIFCVLVNGMTFMVWKVDYKVFVVVSSKKK